MGIKYKIKCRISKIKRNVIFFLYKKLYNIEMKGFHGSMRPSTGKGKYVSVYRKRDIIEIINEKKDEMVRIIPYEPNHGNGRNMG